MSDDDVIDVVAGVLAARTGLRTTVATRARLESSVRQRATLVGCTIHEYAADRVHNAVETQALIDLVTVQETSFFRDPAHIDALLWHVVSRRSGPVVVWSAGCATGQEPYSIAMALDEAGVDDWRIVATDLSRIAVERTAAGRYTENELRGLSAARRGRYLRAEGGVWQVDARIRERITVERHNLLTDPIPLAPCEATAVFCRNVFIYLDRQRIAGFLGRLRRHLVHQGVLFLGGSESLWHVPDGYALDRVGGAFAYRAADAATPATPEPVRGRTRVADAGAPAFPRAEAPVAAAALAAPERSAVQESRRAVYLHPDDPLAHLQLGLSLQAEGDEHASHRAFRAARAALDRTDVSLLEPRLEGYRIGALRTLLDAKVAEGDR